MSPLIQQTAIIGGGFTGLYTAIDLRRNNFPHSIILVIHLIRQGTYMSLLLNPVHNLQAGLKWFNEGVLKRYLEPAEPASIAKGTAGAVVTAVVARKVVHALGSDDK